MPSIHVHLLKGATLDQKRVLVGEISGTLTRVLGTAPEYIHVILDEVEPTDWGYAGQLTSDYFAARAKPAAVQPDRPSAVEAAG